VSSESPQDRRRALRMPLVLPVRVKGFLQGGAAWEEQETTRDVSQGGASFPLKNPVELGQVLQLTLPLPRRLRDYDLREASYRVFSLVRHVDRREATPLVGVMFFGKFPPRGFDERPNARFFLPTDRLPDDEPEAPPRGRPTPAKADAAAPPEGAPAGWTGPERRRYRRESVSITFTLQQVDEWGTVLQEELARAEDLSPGGAKITTTLTLRRGDVLLMSEAGGGFVTRAEVREAFPATPGSLRLHLRFVDRELPDRMLTRS
jgi:hypothetical protein